MLKIQKFAIVLILSGVAVPGVAQSPPLPTAPVQQPIRVDIVNHADPEPAWTKWVSLTEKIAWPAMALVGLLVFRKPLSNFLDVVGKRATEISIGGLGIKLPTMSEAPLSDDVLTFKATDALTVINDSAKRTLFNMFQRKEKFEFAVINLGRGLEWLSSRLYIFALMLQRMKGLKCIVFVAAGASTDKQFIGITTPEKIRWSLAQFQPWLETAYIQAQQGPAMAIQDEYGGVIPDTGEQIVRNFLTAITTTVPPPVDKTPEWVLLGTNQQWEHAVWLSREYLEPVVGFVLWKDSVVSSELKKEAKDLIHCSAPFVAKIKKNGEFVSLIDRVAFLDEVATKIADRPAANS